MARQIKDGTSWKRRNTPGIHGKGLLGIIGCAVISRHAQSTWGFLLSLASGKFDNSEVSNHNASITAGQALLRRVQMLQ